MIRSILLAAAIAASFTLAGCATMQQQPRPHADLTRPPQALAGQRVGVALVSLPKPGVSVPGAGCLLCVAAAMTANSGLARLAESLGLDEFRPVRQGLVAALRAKGMDAVVIDEEIDLTALPDSGGNGRDGPQKDFSAIARKYGLHKLLVVQLDRVGFERTYSAYIPRSDPRAVLAGNARLINLQTNRYEWYKPVHASRQADGRWDEDRYPGLTNAYYQVLEMGKDDLVEAAK